MRSWAPAVLAAFVLLSSPASADPTMVRQTIEAQLSAFRAGDADAAYALAAPSIQRMFPTPERFLTMVKRGYEPVTQAQAPTFLRAKSIDETHFAQEVLFSDPSGQSWTALYTLSRDDGGTWRIDGCYLRKAEGQAA